ncbi:gamma-glutamylcyclotransferase family protein [Rhizorhapis sp. SPR117]|uniref:gamma-glutamylcyclotransferase family protein n=1 Tax=Rhizorhapis sp. SPR117 TaxID=2912611 RepID=UPI001F19F98E|nr:gamma-glutamylcyclotransferase [Rhizorhapis sp. SPR117]
MTDPDLLFVYGSLRRSSDHPMAATLASGADYVGTATTQGALYRIDWYPGLVRTDDPGSVVNGDLFHLHSPENLLPLLDDYEECTNRFPQPHEYRREVTMVRCNGMNLSAWAYYYNHPVTSDMTLIWHNV